MGRLESHGYLPHSQVMETGRSFPANKALQAASLRPSRFSTKPRAIRIRPLLSLLALFAMAVTALAGPPYVTDDPDPLEYRHWEIDIASMLLHDADGWNGTAPHVEFNYGVTSNLQLHVLTPTAFASVPHESAQIGYGYTEVGAKYRFLEEGKILPEAAIYPVVQIPPGSSSREIVSPHTEFFIPIWVQKRLGKWILGGGGGYWVNPGSEFRNWWFMGCVVQRKVSQHLTLGAEIFHETVSEVGGTQNTTLNAGAIVDLSDTYHLLFSAGHSIQGSGTFIAYVGLQITFGPKKPDKDKSK